MRRSALPALLLSCLAACSGESRALQSVRPGLSSVAFDDLPDLKKVAAAPQPPPPKPHAWTPENPPFVYPLPFDHGVRKDHGGNGNFLAPRSHGKHNGIDFLAPVGTDLLAICSGRAKSAMRGGYGRTVQLVCKLPADLGGDEDLYVSFFYAHLDKTSIQVGYQDVKAGAKIGTVGKTGNASGADVMPHLHLEAIVRGSQAEALAEHHSGLEPKAKEATDTFFADLQSACLHPAHLTSEGDIRRERRVDPYLLLTCAARPKPTLTTPDTEPLRSASIKWSNHYASTTFDVDEGPRLAGE
jgi:murein DD-endopeptidase MepM/ murein hydrolase activator NlpD